MVMAKKASPVKTAVKKPLPAPGGVPAAEDGDGSIVRKQKAKNKTPRLSTDLKRQVKIQKALYEIADAASAVMDMQDFYLQIHRVVGELMYAGNFFIATYDEKSGLLSFPYFVDEDEAQAPPTQPLADFRGMTSWVIRTGNMIKHGWDQSNELLASGEIRLPDAGKGNEDGIAAPLKVDGKTIGVVFVQSYIQGIEYTDEDEDVLEFVAQHIAIALTRARAIEETRQRNSELAILNSVGEAMAKTLDVKTVTKIVGDKVRDIFGADQVGILLLEQQTNLLHLHYGYDKAYDRYVDDASVKPIPLGKGLTSKVIESRQPLLFGTQEEKKGGHYMPPELVGQIKMCESWLGVPIMVADSVLGAVLIEDYRPHAYNENHLRLLQTLSSNMGIAIQNARLFDETQRLLKETEDRAAELAIINRVQEGLASKLDMQAIYELVGGKIRETFNAQVVSIATYDRAAQLLYGRYYFEDGRSLPGITLPSFGFRKQVVENCKPIMINEDMPRWMEKYDNPVIQGSQPKSAIFIPMIVGDEATGVISLQNNDQENAFTQADQRLLTTLANSMSVALENARLWEQEKLYRKALEREFEIGREIQAGFLPETLPQPKGWEIAASLKSAREVAGDFYDVFELPDGKIGLVIGDVCDKGLGAALFMTLFRSLIRAISNIDFFARVESDHGDSPAARLKNAISLTNNYIAEIHGNTGMFATIFFGILDTNTGMLTYINSGHLPPLLVNAQGVKEILKISGPAVGALADADYFIRQVMIEQGESLFAYTDGLTDTANPEGELFNEKDLLPLLAEDESLSSLLAEFQKRAADHAAGVKQFDDITLLAARRL
jgi:serine phosphatase RsbU (regulator of sigma subunit)/uncharacterized protein YigA (DUF484 family)